MILLDGKDLAKRLRDELRNDIAQLGQTPRLGIVIVGHNPASETYVANKMKAAAEVGIEAVKFSFEDSISQDELLAEVARLNQDDSIDGFIVQLPLPKHIDEAAIVSAIDYRKDVDGLTPENVGRTMQGQPSIVSATPRGIRTLLARYNIPTDGQHIVVVGRSNIVGKPMAMLLMQKHEYGNATVTLCHSHTRNLQQITASADILIVAAGSPKLITADMVKPGATVIDVGINRVEDATSLKGFRLCGDVDFEAVAPKCFAITPVPGGVGPMTIVSLLRNLLTARKLSDKSNC